MTLYEKFKEMNIRHSAIGLEQSNTDVTYYCICFEWDVREGCTGTMDAVTIDSKKIPQDHPFCRIWGNNYFTSFRSYSAFA